LNEVFDIEAKAGVHALPDSAPKEARERQLRLMLRTLLAERFKLAMHTETRDQPLYALTVAPGGPRLRPSPQGRTCPAGERCGHLDGGPASGVKGLNVTIADLVDTLISFGERHVIDRTGITGEFDIDLPPWNRAAQSIAPAVDDGHEPVEDPNGPSIFVVLRQLGLRLEPTRGPLALQVVDHVERPTANDQQPAPVPVASQRFAVTSIRPCAPEAVAPGARSGGGGNGSFSPGRVYLNCFIVKNLITSAYVNPRGAGPDDPLNRYPRLLTLLDPDAPQPVRGGPSWMYSEKYTIEAKADGLDPTQPNSVDRRTMMGPMLRTLLEDRFKLKLHQESEEAPMYALTVARGGLKVKPIKDGDCTNDRSNGPVLVSDALRRGVKPTCGTINGGPDGSNWRYDQGGQDFVPLANVLSNDLGIMVMDRTGITDKFNITWEYGPDDRTPGVRRWLDAYGLGEPTTPATAPDIFTALREQIGLQLEKTKGTRAYLVIDQIERPSADQHSGLFHPPARAQGPGSR